jgi:hypothetical protein
MSAWRSGAPERGRWWRLNRRVTALEQLVATTSEELRTRRLVVVDGDGAERIVGAVVDGTAELSVVLGDPPPLRTGVVLFASPPSAVTDAGTGLQVWAEGDAQGELATWSDRAGWQTGVFLQRAPARGADDPHRRY